MNSGQVKEYVKTLRTLGRQMSKSAVPRTDIYLLAHAETGKQVDRGERHYSLFYENAEQWALAIGVGNPSVVQLADEILDTLKGAGE